MAIKFKGLNDKLLWHKDLDMNGIYQVSAETFDKSDWHCYEHYGTTVEARDVVVDVGAAEGLFSLTAVGRCKKAYIVEPNPLFFDSLQNIQQVLSVQS